MLLAASYSAQAKNVAIVYDDSRSMSQGGRWNPANYAMQIITALLGDQDKIWLVRMSGPYVTASFQGVSGIEDNLMKLKSMRGLASGGTPYTSIHTAINKLPGGSMEENWLLVVTDAEEFSEFDEKRVQQDIQDAVIKKHAHAIFVVIENPGNNQGSEIVDYWVRHGQAIRMNVQKAGDIPSEMEKLATLLEHSAGPGGLKDVRAGAEIAVSSEFPLRRLLVLRQDTLPGALQSASHGTLGALDVRQYIAKAQKSIPQTPSTASIYHLHAKQVMDAGKDIIKLKFDAPTDQMRYKLIPDVAARFEVVLKDDIGKPIQRDASGQYPYCEGSEVRVEARLLDDSGKPITVGRKDIASFEVSVNYPPNKMVVDAHQERFLVGLKPTGNVGLTPYAKYPGYFHLLGDPMQLQPSACVRDIQSFVRSGLDHDGTWSSPLDAIKATPFIHLSAMVDGHPISKEEFDRWTLRDVSGFLDIERQGTDWLLRPHAYCCAFFWARPSVGLVSAHLSMESDRLVDKIRLPPAIKFNLTSPETRARQIWWIACPYVTWIGLLLALWYVWRLTLKDRFGAKARLWVNHPEQKSTYSIKLRKKASWFLRWFWPSRREKANVEGLTLFAVGKKGAAIIVAGKALGKQHEIDGWNYDEVRTERRMPQMDARVSDGGDISIRHPQPTRFIKFACRYRYTATVSIPQDW